MFHVKTKIMPSRIHGLGLFANENIPKGKIVYSVNSDLDLILSQEKYNELSEGEKQTIDHYGYLDKTNGYWHLSFDDIRFCNHDPEGNLTLCSSNLVAKREVKKDEEITQNYGEFEELRKNLPG